MKVTESFSPQSPINLPNNQLFTPLGSSSQIEQSKILSSLEKRVLTQVNDCVHKYGIDNQLELFNAADYCFDVHFGQGTKNMIKIEDYLTIMGASLKPTLKENDDISADFFAHDRLGFFILTPDKKVFFLKEGPEESFVIYNSETDTFKNADSFPITGYEMLLILNKNQFPEPKTYHGTHTPTTSDNGRFYHEVQIDRKCAIHAAHAFLGFPCINETDLSLLNLENVIKITTDYSLPPVQIQYFNNKKRFEIAQGSIFQSDLGNDSNSILGIFSHLAQQGILDKRFGHLQSTRMHHIDVMNDSLPNYTHYEPETYYNKLIEVLDVKIKEAEPDYLLIEKQLEQMERDGTKYICEYDKSLTLEYVALHRKTYPYSNLVATREMAQTNVYSLKKLKTKIDKLDRMMVCNLSHVYTLRKREDGKWAYIDSQLPDQEAIEDPLSWLFVKQNEIFQTKGGFFNDFIF